MISSIPTVIFPQVAQVAIKNYAAFSYLYYVKDTSVVSDGDFDELCKWMHENFEQLKPHDINNYLDLSALEAGTGFNIANKVTGLTQVYAEALLKRYEEGKMK